jgi:hypothetical protein|tara:strand:+ start:3888 stop:4118 length:231 start_codon:yes stop_codon:yes gene_type:complete
VDWKNRLRKMIEAFRIQTFQYDNAYDRGYIYAMIVNMVMITLFSAVLKKWWHIPIFIVSLMIVEYLGRVYVWHSNN